MVKKSLFVGGGVVLLLALLFGRDALSYVQTGISRTREAVKDAVPLEFEIGRAERMIKDLDPEIRRNMHVIAKEEVEVADLKKNVDDVDGRLAKSEKDVLRLTSDLKRGDSNYFYNTSADIKRSFTSDEVKTELENRFAHHKAMEETKAKLTKIVSARQKGLSAAQEKLTAMKAAKGQLEVELQNLRARLELVKVAQASSSCQFDDSSLSRARGLMKDISTRIDVQEKLSNADTSAVGEIDLEEKVHTDITSEVSKYFGAKSDENIVKLD